MTMPQLKLETLKVRQLIEAYRAGHIAVPEFQREYVWNKSKAPKLIDSLYRAFPISSLWLWESAEPARARRANPRPTRAATTSWLIDGQQRLITLARTLSGEQGIEVVYHPENDNSASRMRQLKEIGIGFASLICGTTLVIASFEETWMRNGSQISAKPGLRRCVTF